MTYTTEQSDIQSQTTDFLTTSDLPVDLPPELPNKEVNEANWRDCLDEEAGLEEFQETTTLDSEGREGEIPQDPYKVKTKRSFASSPMMALGLVIGSTTIALFLVGGIFYVLSGAGELFASSSTTAEADKGPKSPYAQVPENEQITKLRQRLSQKERDANVRQFNDKANQPTNPTTPPIKPDTAPPPTVTRPVIPPPAEPKPIRPVVASRPAPLPPAPVAVPPPSTVSNQPAEDPYSAWERLANLGAYQGNSDFASAPASAYPTQTAAYNSAPSSSTALVSDSDRIAPPDESDTYTGGTQVPIGTTAKAKLMMPIVWNNQISLDQDTILAELSQPLGDLPKGAILSLKVDKQADRLLLMSVERATVNGVERTIPDGVKVNGAGGEPIIAKVKGNGGGITLRDVAGVALAGLGNVAAVLNRPQQRTTLAADGISQIVEDSSNRNLLAAVGQGVSERILATAQDRVENVQSSRQPYYKVSEDKSLQILVTQSIYL